MSHSLHFSLLRHTLVYNFKHIFCYKSLFPIFQYVLFDVSCIIISSKVVIVAIRNQCIKGCHSWHKCKNTFRKDTSFCMSTAEGIWCLEKKITIIIKIFVFDLGDGNRGWYYNYKVAKLVIHFDFRSQENRNKIMGTVHHVYYVFLIV